MSVREPTEVDAARLWNAYVLDQQKTQIREPPYYTPTRDESMLAALKRFKFVIQEEDQK